MSRQKRGGCALHLFLPMTWEGRSIYLRCVDAVTGPQPAGGSWALWEYPDTRAGRVVLRGQIDFIKCSYLHWGGGFSGKTGCVSYLMLSWWLLVSILKSVKGQGVWWCIRWFDSTLCSSFGIGTSRQQICRSVAYRWKVHLSMPLWWSSPISVDRSPSSRSKLYQNYFMKMSQLFLLN